ncbi:MAG TPA: hypothetical protein VH740_23450 [Vicinamibacterales bacterium]
MLQPTNPIIVRVVEEPVKGTTIIDVLVGSLGLTTALLLAAVVLGAMLGGVLIGIKLLRARFNLEPVPDSESLRVTPNFQTKN